MSQITYNALNDKLIMYGYPNLLHDIYNESLSNLIYFNISYFDHWLTESEYCSTPFVCYADTIDNHSLLNDFNHAEKIFKHLYKAIYLLNHQKLIAAMIDNHYFMIGNKYYLYMKYIKNALKENPICQLVFIELGMVIDLRYDLTHTIYLPRKMNNNHLLKSVQRLARRNNLFII